MEVQQLVDGNIISLENVIVNGTNYHYDNAYSSMHTGICGLSHRDQKPSRLQQRKWQKSLLGYADSNLVPQGLWFPRHCALGKFQTST